MEYHFFTNLFWQDERMLLMEETSNYVWSLVYQLRFQSLITEGDRLHVLVEEKAQQFFSTFEDLARKFLPQETTLNPQTIAQVMEWATKAFSFEEVLLRQEREKDV
jgi:hypothetical protein